MTKKIFKYELPVVGKEDLELPVGAQILHVGSQENVTTLWALVDVDSPTEPVHFAVFFTGQTIPLYNFRNFIGTVEHKNGLVSHVFEIGD